MVLRRRAQRKTSSQDDNERLLPAIELQEYPLDASSLPTYNLQTDPSSPNGYPNEPPPRNPLRRVATCLNLSSCIDTLISRPQRHFPSPQIIVRRSEEEPVQSSPEMVLGKRRSRLARSRRSETDTETGFRLAMTWYFWAPPSTETAKVKDCPTLGFLRVRLAPPGLWL